MKRIQRGQDHILDDLSHDDEIFARHARNEYLLEGRSVMLHKRRPLDYIVALGRVR